VAGNVQTAKPFNIRLPAWAVEYIDERAEDRGTTKTEVVVEALRSLRAQEIEGLMREGYEEMREIDRRLAEESMAASAGGSAE